MDKFVVIDRIEKDIAILELEAGCFIEVPLKFLPKGVKEGNVLKMYFELAPDEEKRRKDKVKELQDRLKKKK